MTAMHRTQLFLVKPGLSEWSGRKSGWIGFVCAILLLSGVAQADSAPREWTSADGRKVEASLIRHDIDKGQVALRLTSNSRDILLKLEQLGEDDVAFLAELARKEGQEIIRNWTSADGKSIRARMISHDEKTGVVRLRRADGKEFDLPLDRLSDEDRKMVEDRAAAIRAARAVLLEEAAKVAGTRVKHPIKSETPCSFEVYYPPSYSPDKLAPMMLLFSAGGQGAALIENYKQPAEKLGWVLVGCNGPKNGQDLAIGSKMVADMFSW
jgi:DNA-binding transcriptional ArsR family regulator